MPTVSGLGAYAHVAHRLGRLIFRPCTPENARARIRQRLAVRDWLFLQVVEREIWLHAASPYKRMLAWAGWSMDRLAESVRLRGLEATLGALRDAGVFLTYEEFKGWKPIERAGFTLQCSESDFDNTKVRAAFELRTSGTRSRGSRVPASLDYLADQRTPARCVMLEALGVGSWPIIVWKPAVAHGGGLVWWLALAHMGRPALRWFSMTDPSGAAVPRRHRVMFRLGQLMGMTRGLRIPYPEYAPLADADMVLDAVRAARDRHGGCVVAVSPSVGVRLAGLARQRRIDLEHVTFVVSGEPLTPGKYEEIMRSGAGIGARYSITELGSVGSACARPVAIDDVHLMSDSFALILNRRPLPDGTLVDSLVFTTLLPSSPKILLNVESDDFGDVTIRRCGCIWDELGMHTHLSAIRSFSKLTGEGVTVLGTDCVRILEQVLPQAFGGRSIDYQLLEAEDDEHMTRIYLVVSPVVGPIDEARIRARFIEELGGRNRSQSVMPPLWREAETIRVVRREPVLTAGGKHLPFHTQALVSGGPEPLRQQ
ncbi:MAG: hypothetical protein ACRDIC_05420 [bacterium]